MTTRSQTKEVSQQNQRIFNFEWYRTLPEQGEYGWQSYLSELILEVHLPI